MPKSRMGGKSTSTIIQRNTPVQATPQAQNAQTPPQPVQQVTPPTPQQIASGNVLPGGGTPFAQFEKMTDDQKADVITKALGQNLPMFLDQGDTQRLAYFTGMSDKPTIVTEAQLKAMPGRDLWRSVHDTYDPKTDIGYTGRAIYRQLATGDFTKYSDTGGSAYGKAIYFDIRKGSYGSGSGYTVMHAKFLPTAKTISYNSAINRMSAEIRSGSKLGQAISQASHSDRVGIWALSRGYDAVVDNSGSNYNMILNRRALALSNKTF